MTASCSSNTASRRSASTMALKQATYDTAQGFGLRAVKDEAVGYAHASGRIQKLPRSGPRADAVRAVKGGYSGQYEMRRHAT